MGQCIFDLWRHLKRLKQCLPFCNGKNQAINRHCILRAILELNCNANKTANQSVSRIFIVSFSVCIPFLFSSHHTPAESNVLHVGILINTTDWTDWLLGDKAQYYIQENGTHLIQAHYKYKKVEHRKCRKTRKWTQQRQRRCGNDIENNASVMMNMCDYLNTDIDDIETDDVSDISISDLYENPEPVHIIPGGESSPPVPVNVPPPQCGEDCHSSSSSSRSTVNEQPEGHTQSHGSHAYSSSKHYHSYYHDGDHDNDDDDNDDGRLPMIVNEGGIDFYQQQQQQQQQQKIGEQDEDEDEFEEEENNAAFAVHKHMQDKALCSNELNKCDSIDPPSGNENIPEMEKRNNSKNKPPPNKQQKSHAAPKQQPQQKEEEEEDDDSKNDPPQQHFEIVDGKTVLYPREYKHIGPVWSFGHDWAHGVTPKYANLKEEVLNNQFAAINEQTWNGILLKCIKLLKGQFANKRKNRWAALLKQNGIGKKHLVALKLYTDFDLLQCEFRKSFRAPYNKDVQRLQEFWHWRQILRETFEKFTHIKCVLRQPTTLFHGINTIMCLDKYAGTYYGPISTTTDLHTARNFAGKNGMILVVTPDSKRAYSAYKILDISWISDYPDEREFLLFDHRLDIKTWILSSDYDQYCYFYHKTFTPASAVPSHIIAAGSPLLRGPSGQMSYDEQMKIPAYLTRLQQLITEDEVRPNVVKKNVDFDTTKTTLSDEEKIDLLRWLYVFAMRYRNKPSKFEQSLNANIQHIMKCIHKMFVSSKMVQRLMLELHSKRKEPEIRSVFDRFFLNTYCCA